MIQKIIFDFDGTLADTRDLFLETLAQISRKYGLLEISSEEAEQMSRLPIRERLKQMGVPLSKLPLMYRESRQIFEGLEIMPEPYPAIKELVYALKHRGYLLYIVSSNTYDFIKRFLEANELEVFEQIFSSRGLFGKHRDIKKLLRKTGLSRQEVLYVGDELRDIETCRRISVPVICVTWGFDSPSLLEEGKPDYLVEHPRDILRLVEDLN